MGTLSVLFANASVLQPPNSFTLIQSIFIENLLLAMHCSGPLGGICKQDGGKTGKATEKWKYCHSSNTYITQRKLDKEINAGVYGKNRNRDNIEAGVFQSN